MNFLIEGDNLASLQLLEKTHKSKIDLIYIDPPYNTGNKDFIYDDKYVHGDDSYKHSKWLSFMEKRLNLAKRLLSKSGIIFISIDDNEQAQLKILCDFIFGSNNFIDEFIWEKNPNPTFLNKYSRSSCEYVLCYANNISYLPGLDGGAIKSTETDAPLQNKGNPLRQIVIRKNVANCKFKDQIIKKGKYGLIELLDDVQIKNGTNTNQFRIVGTFRMTEKTLYERIEKGEKLIFKTNKMAPRLSYKAGDNHFAPLKYFKSDICGTTQIGNNDLKQFINTKEFSYPKPVSLIKYIIQLYPFKKGITILDFFAGSGTTAQAVLELNSIDNLSRKFILCTNNENNICKNVTYKRIKGVIEKLNCNNSLKYMKVDFIQITDKFYYEYANELLKNVKELVELENGINFNGNKELAIILTEKELDEFANHIPSECKIIYLGHNILPTEEQEMLFKKNEIKVNIIPDYYYRDLEN